MDELNANFSLAENQELNANFQLQDEDLSVNFSLNDNEEIKAGFSLSENNLGANFALNEEESIEATFKVNVTPSKVSELVNDKNYVTERELLSAVDNKQDKGDYATKTELTEGLATKQNAGSYVSQSELYDVANTKQDKGDYTTREEFEEGLNTKQPLGDYLESLGLFSTWDELNAYSFKNQAFYSFSLSGEFAGIGGGVYICYCDLFQLSSGTVLYKHLNGFNLSTSKSVLIDVLNRTIKEVETNYVTKNYVDENIETTKGYVDENIETTKTELSNDINNRVTTSQYYSGLEGKADVSFYNVSNTAKSYVTNWVSPSSKALSFVTPDTSEKFKKYEMPSNGYFFASMHGSTSTAYIEAKIDATSIQIKNYGADPCVLVPVAKGQTVTLTWANKTFFYYVKFIYLVGNESEAVV